MKFSESLEETKYQSYLRAVSLYEEHYLTESFSSLIPNNLKRYYDFIKEFAALAKVKMKSLIQLLKHKGVFQFFSKIAFSFKRLFTIVKNGYKAYRSLQRVIAEYVATTKVVTWTAERLKELDAFLDKHPVIKRLGGIAVGAILIYIWLNMSFSGDFEGDFDQSTLLAALVGNYSISEIFAGPEGIKMLILFATGAFLSFPWPGPQSAQFAISIVYGLAKIYRQRIERE